jgi:hypothetical protein
MLVGAAPRGHHQKVVTMPSVDERSAALPARAAAGRSEDQDRGAVPVVALLPIGLDISSDVLLAKQHPSNGTRDRLTHICRNLRRQAGTYVNWITTVLISAS